MKKTKRLIIKTTAILLGVAAFLSGQLNAQITTYPYLEDFENGPGGWVANNSTNGSWALGIPQGTIINSAASGSNAWVTNLSGQYNASENSWVESPIFNFSSLSNPVIQLNIWWESETGWDGMVLQSSINNGITWQNVGATGDPNNWFNQVNIISNPGGQPQGWSGDIATVPVSNSGFWVSATHSLTGLAGQSNVIFRLAFSSDNIIQKEGVAFDDISISELLCFQPNNLNATNIQSTSADLSWTETGSATVWDIEYGAAGFVPTGNPSVAAVTANPFNLTGLSSSTSYDFYVRASCGGSNGSSFWSGPFTFTTPCSVVSAPYFEDVESHTPSLNFNFSNCWEELSSTNYDWNISGGGSTPSSSTGPLGAYSGNNYFYVEASGSAQGDTAILVSPDVDLSALSAPSIEFFYHMYGAVTGNLFIDVFNGTWNAVDSIMGQQQLAQTDPWVKRIVDISSYSGTVKVRFRAASLGSFQGDISIDDIDVTELATCFDPTNLSVTNITPNSVDLTWIESGSATAWDIEHGAAGFVPTGTPTIVATATNPHTLNGLIPATSYDFYVRANCGATNGTSNWSGPYNFTTLCAPMLTPWIDSVEAHQPTTSLSLSNCWVATSSATYDWNIDGFGSTPSSGTGPLSANSGSNYFYVEASSGTLNDTAWLVSPILDVSSLNVPGLEFYYHMYGNSMGNLYIDVFDGNTWTNGIDSIIGQQQINQSDPWLLRSVSLSGFNNTVQIRFRAIRATSFLGDISLDDISVIETLTCPEPLALTVNNVTNTSADLGWTEQGGATLWEIEYDTTGFVQGTGNTFITGSNPQSLFPLVANTAYDFYVRSICAPTDTSAWSGVQSFTTTSVGIDENNNPHSLKLFPNPNSGVFNVYLKSEGSDDLSIEVVNAQGQRIYLKRDFDNGNEIVEKIDLSDQAKGMYFLIITSKQGTQATQFFVQ